MIHANSRIVKIGVLVFLLAWYGFFLVRQMDLSGGDLGRHLKNGELLLATWGTDEFSKILSTNYYSYTAPDFPFVNHHWLSGVIFYIVWSAFGFAGLMAFFVVLSLATLLFFFGVARRFAGFWPSALAAFFLIPLIAGRVEIRPELWSSVFVGVFLWVLSRYRSDKRAAKWLVVLPALLALWVNLHIYWIFGLFLVGVFWIAAHFGRQRDVQTSRALLATLIATGAASIANPHLLRGALYPFGIFGNYGILVHENQSVPAFLQSGNVDATLVHYLIAAAFVIVSVVCLWFKEKSSLSRIHSALAGVFLLLAFAMARNMTLFGFVALPALGGGMQFVGATRWFGATRFRKTAAVLVVVGLTFLVAYPRVKAQIENFGAAPADGSLDATQFIRSNGISGPMFNDFDSGGHVVFELFPDVRPFVDNRPEAYPMAFFDETYFPMHASEDAWRRAVAAYDFNIILYSFSNRSQYTFPFILRRLNDPAWAPVFANRYTIVFLRRTKENEAVIREFEMDKSRFTTVKEE